MNDERFNKLLSLAEMIVFVVAAAFMEAKGKEQIALGLFMGALALAGVGPRPQPAGSLAGRIGDETKKIGAALVMGFAFPILFSLAGCAGPVRDVKVGVNSSATISDTGALNGVSGSLVIEICTDKPDRLCMVPVEKENTK